MRYVDNQPIRGRWHRIIDGITNYDIAPIQEGECSDDGYRIEVYTGKSYWEIVENPELRKRIILAAWPMCMRDKR